MKVKVKNRLHRHDMNRPSSSNGQKYSKYKVSHYDDAYMYYVTPKQHLKLRS